MLRYEDINAGKLKVAEHDMVVLSVGALPNRSKVCLPTIWLEQIQLCGTARPDGLTRTNKHRRCVCCRNRVSADGHPDAILSAGSASSEAISYLMKNVALNP